MSFLALGFAISGFAQGGNTGAITGVVKDPQGAVVPNAKVEVLHQETGITERTVTTNAAGEFTATLLPIGTYQLSVTVSGFRTAYAPGVKVAVTETTSVAIPLQLGQTAETITVNAAAIAVELNSAATGEVIQNGGDLPLATRNFLQLLTLSSGAGSDLFNPAVLGRGQVSVEVNGQRPVNNNYQIEGIAANDLSGGQFDVVPVPNPDAVAEFKTQTSLYDASQGRNGGGNIQVALKLGGSAYHGDVYEFLRNDALNANDFFLNQAGLRRAVLRQNQFGGSFGGPIPRVKDLFFFLNYQGTRGANGVAPNTSIRTFIPALPADRSAASLQKAFFRGAPVPIDPVALAFLNLPASKCPGFNDGLHCIPTLTGTPGLDARGNAIQATQRLVVNKPGTFNEDQFTATLDKQLTAKDKLSARWFFADGKVFVPFSGGGFNNGGLALPQASPSQNRFAKLGWTRILSGAMVNDFHFGFNRTANSNQPTLPITLADIGAQRANSAQFPAAYQIQVTNGFSLGSSAPGGRTNINSFVWGDDVSYNVGKHQLRFGGEFDRYQLNQLSNFTRLGFLTYPNFATFLTGNYSFALAYSGLANFYYRNKDASLYLQDDWKILSRLTLNLGLRWDGMGFAGEKNGAITNLRGVGDGTAPPVSFIVPANAGGGLGTPGVSGCAMLRCFDAKNFAPRVGFAWDLFGDHKTALRGGYGIYYDRISNQTTLQTSVGPPFADNSFSIGFPGTPFSSTPQNPFPTLKPASAFPEPGVVQIPKLTGFNQSTGAPIFDSPFGGAPYSPTVIFGFVRNFRSPYSQQWNLTLEREIAKDWVFSVGYVAVRGVALLGTGRMLNEGQICTRASPCVIPASIGSSVNVPAGTLFTTKNADGSITITGSTPGNVNSRVPAEFLGIGNSSVLFQANDSSSIYHSLQASLVHRFLSGLYFQAAYTFSRSIDNGSGSTGGEEVQGNGHIGDVFDLRGNRGLSNFDRTHRVALSYQYELPFARWMNVENRGFGKIAHGWAVQGTTVIQSNTPFNIIDSTGFLPVGSPLGSPTIGTLQDPSHSPLNVFTGSENKAVLGPGANPITGNVNGYVNQSAFLPNGITPSNAGTTRGNNCVNNQNVKVLCTDPTAVAVGIGSLGRNVFRGPFQQSWDMSFVKTTKLWETSSLEFRAEIFNIFNHPSFQSPQAGPPGTPHGNYGLVDINSLSLAGTNSFSSIGATVNAPRIVQFALRLAF